MHPAHARSRARGPMPLCACCCLWRSCVQVACEEALQSCKPREGRQTQSPQSVSRAHDCAVHETPPRALRRRRALARGIGHAQSLRVGGLSSPILSPRFLSRCANRVSVGRVVERHMGRAAVLRMLCVMRPKYPIIRKQGKGEREREREGLSTRTDCCYPRLTAPGGEGGSGVKLLGWRTPSPVRVVKCTGRQESTTWHHFWHRMYK